ncbi:hypothetical protein ACFVUY_15505 [Kitasatospora sp. NPDC058063]|uniref:hypothetical protein n=1 Tax=unclassified Kitasatospora TaxID=2633591 RepID=UPI0036D87937
MSDLTFWSWFTAAAGCLTGATVLALWLTRDKAPRGRHRADAPRPTATAVRPQDKAEPKVVTPEPIPASEPERQYMGPLIRPHIDHGAWLAELDKMQREYDEKQHQAEPHADQPQETTPEPEGANHQPRAVRPRRVPEFTAPVLPLWQGLAEEEARRKARREALNRPETAPDAGYTYRGAHALAGVVA